MQQLLYPLIFEPVYKDYLWGGRKIMDVYHRPTVPGAIFAESWEISDRPEGESCVENGPLAGSALHALIQQYGTDLLGKNHADTSFPLLIKLIDARQCLSVQVHPNDRNAAMVGGEAKTEMWYVLQADEGAAVYAGLTELATSATFREAIETHQFGPLLQRIPVQPGSIIYIPGGCVHAIDAGCLLLEVQQNSNTTYRIYDWGRIGTDGNPRPLHIDKALQVINWEHQQPPLRQPAPCETTSGLSRQLLLSTDYFILNRLPMDGPVTLPPDASTFRALFAETGSLTIRCAGADYHLPHGRTCLLPAALPECTLIPNNPSTSLLEIVLPG